MLISMNRLALLAVVLGMCGCGGGLPLEEKYLGGDVPIEEKYLGGDVPIEQILVGSGEEIISISTVTSGSNFDIPLCRKNEDGTYAADSLPCVILPRESR